ncbi:hypothetical protein KAT80_03780 [Candidatus Pacearchaeota archaeon]|nr:hypothetical protein [Candidatus Pacearchaeota archaeon]
MRKKIHILFLTLILSLLLSPLISANSFDFENAQYQITRVIDSILGILSPLLETIIGDYNTSEFFFHKILLLILLIIISKNILDKTPIGEDNKKVSLMISVIISILAIRFINENNFFGAIFIQYGTLGIAITSILPMIIFFYFVHTARIGTYGRKLFWALYGIILGAIWISKSSEIPSIANWIYGLTFLAAIVFIYLDKTIHSYLGLSGFRKFEKNINKKQIRKLKKDLQEIQEDWAYGRFNSRKEYKDEKKQIEDQIKELSKE